MEVDVNVYVHVTPKREVFLRKMKADLCVPIVSGGPNRLDHVDLRLGDISVHIPLSTLLDMVHHAQCVVDLTKMITEEAPDA